MEPLRFNYILLFQKGDPDLEPILPGEAPRNVVAVAVNPGPTLAVIWDHFRDKWIFQAAVAGGISTHPERYRIRSVDRATAEIEALRFATIPLPSEAELTALCRAARPD